MRDFYSIDYYQDETNKLRKNPVRIGLESLVSDFNEKFTNLSLRAGTAQDNIALAVEYLSSRLFPLMKSLQDDFGHVFVKDLAFDSEPRYTSTYFSIGSNLFDIKETQVSIPLPKTVLEGGIQVNFDPNSKYPVTIDEELGFDRQNYVWDANSRRYKKAQEGDTLRHRPRITTTFRDLLASLDSIDYIFQASYIGRKNVESDKRDPNNWIKRVYKLNATAKRIKNDNQALINALNNSSRYKYEKYKPNKDRVSRILGDIQYNRLKNADKGWLINTYNLFKNNLTLVNNQSDSQKFYEQLKEHVQGRSIYDVKSRERNDEDQLENTIYFVSSVQFNDRSPQIKGQLTQEKELIGKKLSFNVHVSFDREKNEISFTMRVLDQKQDTLGFMGLKYPINHFLDKTKELNMEYENKGVSVFRVIDNMYKPLVDALYDFIKTRIDKFLKKPKMFINKSENELDEYNKKLLKGTLPSVFDYEIQGEDKTEIIDTDTGQTETIDDETGDKIDVGIEKGGSDISFSKQEIIIIENLPQRFAFLSNKQPVERESSVSDETDEEIIERIASYKNNDTRTMKQKLEDFNWLMNYYQFKDALSDEYTNTVLNWFIQNPQPSFFEVMDYVLYDRKLDDIIIRNNMIDTDYGTRSKYYQYYLKNNDGSNWIESFVKNYDDIEVLSSIRSQYLRVFPDGHVYVYARYKSEDTETDNYLFKNRAGYIVYFVPKKAWNYSKYAPLLEIESRQGYSSKGFTFFYIEIEKNEKGEYKIENLKDLGMRKSSKYRNRRDFSKYFFEKILPKFEK